MTTVDIKNIKPEFSSLDQKSFKKKIYDTCVIYANNYSEFIKNKITNNESKESKESCASDDTSKKINITFRPDVKNGIDFIIGRFLWEIYYAETPIEKQFDSKNYIEDYVLNTIVTDWSKRHSCNITQLIIHSVNSFKPSRILTNSNNLNIEITNKFKDYITNESLLNFVSGYITDFIKLLSIFFSNCVSLEKSKSINIKTFETSLRYI